MINDLNAKFTENSMTQFQNDFILNGEPIYFDEDWDEVMDEDRYPIDEILKHCENVFLNAIAEYLNIKVDDSSALIKEIKKRYAERGITGYINEDNLRKTLSNWLTGKTNPYVARSNRANCYDFCFAMGFDLNTTVEYLFKYFQVMPFYYRNRIDAIYFYCILNNKSYTQIVEMINYSKELTNPDIDTINSTQSIGKRIHEIKDDSEFMNYLKYQCSSDSFDYITIKSKIINLTEEAFELVNKAKDMENKKRIKSDTALMDEITGYTNQNTSKICVGDNHMIGISKSKLPNEFTRSLPTNLTLSKIRNGKPVSDYELRKLLIILKFFCYYKRASFEVKYLTNEDIRELHDDFVAELNMLLTECGYIQLYSRNVFDAHIKWCTNSDKPIEKLQFLIYDKYHNTDDE